MENKKEDSQKLLLPLPQFKPEVWEKLFEVRNDYVESNVARLEQQIIGPGKVLSWQEEPIFDMAQIQSRVSAILAEAGYQDDPESFILLENPDGGMSKVISDIIGSRKIVYRFADVEAFKARVEKNLGYYFLPAEIDGVSEPVEPNPMGRIY